MKHIFLVHSSITYLAALGTICKEELSEEDVLIISRYPLSDNLPLKVLHVDFSRYYRKPWKSKWVYNPLGFIDNLLKQHIGDEPFVAYLEAMVLHAKVLISHKNCMGFHFIEEGASAHYDSVPMPLFLYDDINEYKCPLRYDSIIRRITDLFLVFRGISLKNYALPFMPQCYYYASGVKFYGFGDNSFRGACIKESLSWIDVSKRFEFHKNYQLSNRSIWIGIPPQIMMLKMTPQSYKEGIEKKCIPHIRKSNVNKIYLKHHPVCAVDFRNAELNAFLDNGIDVEVIPDEVCLEMEFIGENYISIYTVMSSIAEYALQMGNNKCYSIAQCFPGYIEEDGTDIWDKVELL